MKAAVLSSPFKIEILDVEEPPIRDNDVLVEVVETGVCGSDLHTYRGVHPFRKPPVILGHEVAGRIYELGSHVKDINVGTKVTVEPQIPCGRCFYCRQGRYNICPHKIVPGVGGWMGTFAEYFVAPAERIFPLAGDVSFTSGVLAEPIAVGLHAARRAKAAEASTLVLGLGPVGIGAAVSAKLLGSRRVVATDIAELNLKVAESLGVDDTLEVSSRDLRSAAREFEREGFDSVIVATGYPEAIDDAISVSRRGAIIVVVSLFDHETSADFNPFVVGEREIVGSSTYTSDEFKTVVDWLERGELKPERMVTHVKPLKKAAEALELLHRRTEPVIKIILRPRV